MKIIIVGAKGFIGSHLVDYFTRMGMDVTSCDVKEGITEPKYVAVHKYNSDFKSIFAANDYDACIYAGGNGSVPYSLEFPEIDFQLNTHTVNSLLAAILKYRPHCRFIHISSAAVYGSPSSLPIDEREIVNPLSPYGWHKYLSECICKKYSTLYGLKTCSIRVFSVYGERLMKQLFWDIYQKIKNSSLITLFGNGNESRDFIYIQDLVVAIHHILKGAEFNGEIINVAAGKEITIRTAAETFCRLYDPNLELKFNNEVKPGDPANWWANTDKLKGLGFKPAVSLDEGLSNYVKWLKEKE